MGVSLAPLTALLLLSSALLGGCAVATTESDESTADAESAFGEATCATMAPTWSSGVIWPPSYTGPGYFALDGNYGSASCAHAIVVDYTHGTTYPSGIRVGYTYPPTSALECGMAHAHAQTFEDAGGGFTPYQEIRLHGVWSGTECTFQPDAGYSALHLSTNPTRIEAQAYSNFCLLNGCKTTYQPVKVQAYTYATW